MHFFSLLLICLLIAGIQCIVLVRPKDVVAEVGNNVSFECSTNSSSSARSDIRWIYTAERNNFRRPNHIYAYGGMFNGWRMRHNVTESKEGLFTLTISLVNSNDTGFYTCMDMSDDSKATAELTLSTAKENEIQSTTVDQDITRKLLKHAKQESERQSETTSNPKLGDEATDNDGSQMAFYALYACSTLIVVFVLIAIGLCLRNSRRHRVSIAKQLNEESSCEKGSPSEQQTLEDLSDYEVIPEYDLKEQPLNLSGSKDNQYSQTIDANDHTAVYVSLAKREPIGLQQPPVYASLNFNTEQSESQRHLFTRCFKKS